MEVSVEVISRVSICDSVLLPESKRMPKIYEEIKQDKPEGRPGQVAVITIFRTADVLRHAVERSLSVFGLSEEQYNVLRILRGTGESGLPTLEISSRMLSRSPNITRLVDRLIAKKLARRSSSKEDRRVVLVSVTSQGLELLSHLDGVVDKAFDNFPPTTKVERHRPHESQTSDRYPPTPGPRIL
jgi:DNA-binding MarR family transcriptional regulator